MRTSSALAIGLIIGLIVGLVIGYVVTPKDVDTTELKQRVGELEGQISTLQNQLKDRDSSIQSLQKQIEDLHGIIRVILSDISLNETISIEIKSASMRPTLEIGDVVLVQKLSNISEINASPDGDIIAFYRPTQGDIIVHRAINKILVNGRWYFKTKGDSNLASDPWEVPEDNVIGKVIAIVHKLSKNES